MCASDIPGWAPTCFLPTSAPPVPRNCWAFPTFPQGPKINAGWPKFSISGLSAFGSTTSQPQYQIPNTYLTSGVLSLQRGAHSIRAGTDITYIQTAILDVSAVRGTFTFANTWTGNPWGDFLLGLPAAYTQTSLTVAYNRNQIYNFFVQDDYRILPNLTRTSVCAMNTEPRSTKTATAFPTTTCRPAS